MYWLFFLSISITNYPPSPLYTLLSIYFMTKRYLVVAESVLFSSFSFLCLFNKLKNDCLFYLSRSMHTFAVSTAREIHSTQRNYILFLFSIFDSVERKGLHKHKKMMHCCHFSYYCITQHFYFYFQLN